VIKALDAAQGSPPPEPSGVEPAADVDSFEGQTPADIPLLTPEEKRRILARIARVNPLDCFDESGAFDLARAKRILPPGMVRHIAIHETTCLNAEGRPVTQRRIHLRLVDPISALRLDDQLERRRERSTSSSSSPSESDSDSPPPHPASPEYAHMLLRQKTKGLEEANHTLTLLKKALTEAGDRKLQLSKELEEKDRQLSEALSLSNGSQTLSRVEGDAVQRDTGCQPVDTESPSQSETLSSSHIPSTVEEPAPSNIKVSQALRGVKGRTPAELAEREARRLAYEREEARNSMGQIAFAEWLRKNRPAEWAQMQSEVISLKHQKAAASPPARSARPPPP